MDRTTQSYFENLQSEDKDKHMKPTKIFLLLPKKRWTGLMTFGIN
jgi:hypothetical protein